MLEADYASSAFRDFESSLRIIVGLDEDDIQLILKQYNSKFTTYEIPVGNYSIKDLSEVVYTKGVRSGSLQLDYDDITMKTKPILNHISGEFINLGTLRFNEKSFLYTLLGFTPHWDYTPSNEYFSEKIMNINKIEKFI